MYDHTGYWWKRLTPNIRDKASFSNCEYPFSALVNVLDANAIGLSIPFGNTWDKTPPLHTQKHQLLE